MGGDPLYGKINWVKSNEHFNIYLRSNRPNDTDYWHWDGWPMPIVVQENYNSIYNKHVTCVKR